MVMVRPLPRLAALAAALALALTFSAIAPAVAEAGGATRVESAEWYALKLLNCTRTGGWVTSTGKCLGKFSGTYSAKRKPLRMHKRLSNKVAYPWARTITIAGQCAHELAGEPGLVQRFRRKGFTAYPIGENIGCGSGTAKAAVLHAHRMMQAEKRYDGGHWKNIKNRRFKSVGIGVATDGARTMVVYDFYGRLY